MMYMFVYILTSEKEELLRYWINQVRHNSPLETLEVPSRQHLESSLCGPRSLAQHRSQQRPTCGLAKLRASLYTKLRAIPLA